MNRNRALMYVWLIALSVPYILGATSDFPEKEAERAPENKERADKERTDNKHRKPRQSFSFTTFPFQGQSINRNQEDGPLSFQNVRMGSSDGSISSDRATFRGFNFDNVFTPSSSSSPLPRTPSSVVRARGNTNTNTNAIQSFQNFPSLSRSPPASTESLPIVKPTARTLTFARNRDPRRRMRNRVKTRDPVVVPVPQQPRRVVPIPEQPRRLNFVELTPSRPQESQSESRGGSSSSSTRVSSLVASSVQNSLEETVRSLEQASKRNDELIQNCIKEAEKHQAEIEELENRTSLHIEYAQEKQIEIQHLETIIEGFRNQSKNQTEREAEFEKRISNFVEKLDSKDSDISKLKADIARLEESFNKEEVKKHHEISALNDRLDNASVELANNQIRINQLLEEKRNYQGEINALQKSKDMENSEFKKKMEKFKREKLNLLKIVQQLADLGNPANNPFNIQEEDYEMLSNAEEAKEESCCDNTDNFVNYDVNQGLEENQIDREFVSDEEYRDVEYIQEEEEEGSTSLENLVEATENAADDERNDEDV